MKLSGYSRVVAEAPPSGSTRIVYRDGLMKNRREIAVPK